MVLVYEGYEQLKVEIVRKFDMVLIITKVWVASNQARVTLENAIFALTRHPSRVLYKESVNDLYLRTYI